MFSSFNFDFNSCASSKHGHFLVHVHVLLIVFTKYIFTLLKPTNYLIFLVQLVLILKSNIMQLSGQDFQFSRSAAKLFEILERL